MTKLFRNDSPEALTRQQAVALEKKRMKERARQARELAAAGRGEDTEIAHVALGEMIVPAALQSPEVLDILRRAAASQNIPFDRLRVGSRRNSINPNTGVPEFGSELDLWGYGYDPFDPPDGIPGIDVVAPRWDGGGNFFDNINFGSGERPGGGASAPQQPSTVPGPPIVGPNPRAQAPSLVPPPPTPANRLPPHVYKGPVVEGPTVIGRSLRRPVDGSYSSEDWLNRYEGEPGFGKIDGSSGITFENDESHLPHTNRAVHNWLANTLKSGSTAVGPFNINSTTGGLRNFDSPHHSARGADINSIRGYDVEDPDAKPHVDALVGHFRGIPEVELIIGPYGGWKRVGEEWAPITNTETLKGHRDHIHVSVKPWS